MLLNDKGVDLMKTIMARSCNTWDTAPSEVFELHDLVIHNQLLQDYQGKSPMPPRREELTPEENMKLDRYASDSSQSGE